MELANPQESGCGNGFKLAVLREQLGQRVAEFCSIDYFDRIGSTNAWLMQQTDIHTRLCVADCQTAGRGRLGRQWRGGTASNLEFSLGWQMATPLNPAISLVVGLAVVRALSELGIDDAGLKWPNDIMLARTKLGGILVESRAAANGAGLCDYVIGIGLNVRLDANERQLIGQAVTDLVAHGYNSSREYLLSRLLVSLLDTLADLHSQGLASLLAEWQQKHIYQGQDIALHLQGQPMVGTVIGVNEQGALGLRIKNELRYFHSGEIQILKSSHSLPQ